MSLKRLFLIQFMIQFSLIVGLGLMILKLFHYQGELSKSRDVHYQSWLLADELRQSSDDLTRMARTYVATGNPEYERQYWTVLDIRNGKIPHPVNYHQIYWDLVTESNQKPRLDGQTVSLHALMVKEGFTRAEFDKLAEAQKISDELVKVEMVAMNAMKGLFKDSSGNFTVKKEPDRELAIRLMNDQSYHETKAKIMGPINDFYTMFDKRTTLDLQFFEKKSKSLLLGILIVIIIIIGTFFYTFRMMIRQINQREKAEDSLRKDEARLRDIIWSSSNWVWEIDHNWNYCYSSDNIDKILGYSTQDVIGKSPFDFMTKEEKLHLRPYFQKIVETKGVIKDLENWNLHKDGHEVCLLTNGFPVIDENSNLIGFRGVDKDITVQKRNLEILKESEDKFRTLIETMTDGVYRSSHEGKFLEVNSALVKMLGYNSKEELKAIDIKSQLYFDENDRVSEALEETLEEMAMFRLKKKDGTEIWVEDHGRHVLDKNGEILYHEGSLRDVSERKRAEDEIKMKNMQLELINSEKDKFFSVLAHDLKGPFSSFLGLTQMMVEDLNILNKDEIKQLAIKLKNSSINLYSLLENLLEWASLKRGITTFNPKNLELRPFINESIESVKESAHFKEINISIEIADGFFIHADPYMISTVIRNLVSNAVKFTPKGGSIIISDGGPHENFIDICIKDNGIGMSEDIRTNLFNLDKNTSRRGTAGEPSTGLGLILCKEFVEKHGGNIKVESLEGQGSSFCFNLPIVVSSLSPGV